MPKRVLTGTVVSDKGDKTVVVRVERRVKHPLYGKIIRLSKKYHAHDEANEMRAGEQVRIEECAPLSKLKSWTVLDRIGAAKAAVVEIAEVAESEPPKPVKQDMPAKAAAPEPETEKPAEIEEVAAAPEPENDKPAETEEVAAAPKPKTKKPAKPAKAAAAKPKTKKPAKAEDGASADGETDEK